MKSAYLALILAVALAVGGNGPVQARPFGHSGTSSSMRSGFSSQKSIPLRPAPPPASRSSGPGAFGKAAPQADARSTSASSRDMERNAAQANALKTLDARRNAATAAAAPVPPLHDSVMRPQQPVYNQPAYPQQLPQPIIVQAQSSGWLTHGLIGFMLGRAMSQQTQMSYPPYGQPGVNTNGTGTTVDGATAPVAAAAMTPVPATAPVHHSFAATVLRVFFWLALVSGLVWLVAYMVWKLRRIRAANAAHYSFERN